jgi:hypothetical protein
MGGESLDKKILLRLDPFLHHKLKIWAKDDIGSINAHIEFILRKEIEESRG